MSRRAVPPPAPGRTQRRPGRNRWWVVALTGVVGLLVVSAVHVGIERGDLFDTEPWRASAVSVVFTAATAATAALALFGVRRGMARPWTVRPPSDRYSIVAWLGAVAPLVVLLWSPEVFDLLSLEDRPVELVSAAANLLTAGLLVLALTRRRGAVRLGLALTAAAFFFVGMEEISWFQRLFDFGTPTVLEANEQGEANLHNLATDAFQSAYYLGAALLLVVVPYVATCLGTRWSDDVRGQLPGRLPLTLGAVAVAYNYTETSYVASQVAFWLTVAALALWPDGPGRRWSTVLLVHVCVAQMIMFARGPDLPRDWAPSEYREMFIGLGFVAWAVELRRFGPAHLRHRSSPSASEDADAAAPALQASASSGRWQTASTLLPSGSRTNAP